MDKKTKDENREMVESGSGDREPAYYEPFTMMRNFDRLFDTFRRDMDRVFWEPGYAPGLALARRRLAPQFWAPRVDIQDEADHYTVEAELPGVDKKDVDITVEGNRVELKMQSSGEMEEKEEGYLLRERSARSFQRSFQFPEEVVPDKAEARMDNGVLRITLPKKEPAPPPQTYKLDVK